MPDHFRFAHSEVRPAARQLLIGGVPAALGARAFDVLVALIERRDRVVDKSELFDTVWPGLVVEENNLQVQVSSLRKLLGPNVIATVSGRGYRFVADLVPDAPRAEAALREETPVHPNNLPRARTRFIGREKALDDCAGLLRDTRLLTLSGVGGCGKTRLAQELAQRQLGEFEDGVWFVDLGPLQEAERVPATVAATLGVPDAGASALERLTSHLKSRHTLVVLDNCEHVIDATIESVEALLTHCDAVKIVATSREVLGTPGEQVFAVRSLSLPATMDIDAVRSSEAVRLFVDHARLVSPEFAVDERNAAAITDICRRLDGIALAIELAAARVRVLTVNEIRARLDDRFRLLTGGNRAMPRHQTLHATMQWSHDHLTPGEQRLFRRISVFAGGCTLAAATDVTGDSADEYDTLERLTALHDKSLLMVDRDTQSQPRYRMLQTVRQYAEERLTEAGEADGVRTRHLLHYVALGERVAPELNGPRQGEWLAALQYEQENLVTAHAWCAHAANGGELALRLIASLWRYWFSTAQHATGLQFARAALELCGDDFGSSHRPTVLLAMATFALRIGLYDDVTAYAQRCLPLARAAGDARTAANAQSLSGSALLALKQRQEALAAYNAAADTARAAGDWKALSTALNGMAEVHRDNGDFAQAAKLYEEGLAQVRPHGDARGAASLLGNLTCALIEMNEIERARATFCEAVSLTLTIGNRGALCCGLDTTAALAAATGDHGVAARLHGAGTARLDEAGMRHEPVDEAFIAAWIARSRAALGAHAFAALEAEGKALGYEASLAEMDRWLNLER